MKKLVTALLAVAVLGGPAFAGEEKDAGKATGGKQGVEEAHQAHADKKARKARKDPHNTTKPVAPKTETKPTTEPVPAK